MNSLGLEYGSSSSDEEDAASPPKTKIQPVAAPVPAFTTQLVLTSASKASDNSNEAITDQPDENTAEQAVELAATPTGVDVSMSNVDEETMLLQAGIPSAAAPLAADNETQQRIERFLRVQHERGQDFQTTLQDKKEVRNPYILEKVVEYFGIDELQSNFSPDKFDPHGLPLHEYTDVLAMEQKKRADARAQRQLQQQRDGADPRQIKFVSANALNSDVARSVKFCAASSSSPRRSGLTLSYLNTFSNPKVDMSFLSASRFLTKRVSAFSLPASNRSVYTKGLAKDLMDKSCYSGVNFVISEEATVLEALTRMVGINLGCLAVSGADGKFVGVVTERDYLRKVELLGLTAKNTPVGQIMTQRARLVVAKYNETPNQLMSKMLSSDIRHLPVVNDDGDLAGMLSIKDLVREINREHHADVDTLCSFAMGRGGHFVLD